MQPHRPLTLTLLATLAACSHGSRAQQPAAAAPPAPVAEAPVAEPALVDGVPYILDVGAEPRFELRYRPPAGTVRTMAMEMDIAMGLGSMGQTTMPTMMFNGTIEVLSVDADGAFTIRTIYDDTDVRALPGQEASTTEAMRVALEGLEHLSILSTFSARGRGVSAEIEPGTATSAATEQMVEQSLKIMRDVAVSLPEQAVGRGARWKIADTITSQSMRMETVTEFELVEVTETSAHVRATIAVTLPRQRIQSGGQQVTVEGSGTGATEGVVDLVTFESDISVETDITMSMSMTQPVTPGPGMGQPATTEMEMTMNQRMRLAVR